MEKQTLTRQDLYNLVWSQSLLSLSRKYEISNVGLQKICVNMSIPLPRAGHWEKLKHGKPVSITKLSKEYTGKSEVTLSIRNDNETKQKSFKASIINATKEIQNTSNIKLNVPLRLTNPDKLVIAAKTTLESKQTAYGHYKGVVSTAYDELTIRVSTHLISRSLRIIDTLIKALRQRKHDISISNGHTCVIIDEQEIKISIKEKLKRVIVPGTYYNNTELHPTGILSFRIEDYNHTEWKDGNEPLESQLPKILARLEIKAAKMKQEKEERDKWWAAHQEKERIAKELEARKEKDLEAFKDTLLKANRWHKATNLRNYISEVEKKALGSESISKEMQTWLTWARKKADWYDPFIESEDALLDEIDRETLTFKKKPNTYSW